MLYCSPDLLSHHKSGVNIPPGAANLEILMSNRQIFNYQNFQGLARRPIPRGVTTQPCFAMQTVTNWLKLTRTGTARNSRRLFLCGVFLKLVESVDKSGASVAVMGPGCVTTLARGGVDYLERVRRVVKFQDFQRGLI